MPYKNGIWQGMFQQRSVPVLSDVAVTFFSSIITLTPNGNFWIEPLLHSVSDMPFAVINEEQFYVEPSVYGLSRWRLPVGYLIAMYWAESATHLHTTCRTIAASGVSLGQRFSNFFQVGTTFISQNVLRTTLLLGLLNSLGLP